MPGQKHVKSAIVIAFALETGCVTWFLKIPGATPVLSILYLVTGSAIALMLLSSSPLALPRLAPGSRNLRVNIYRVAVLGLLALAMHSLCRYWFDEIPLDVNYADMLPIIKVMDQRFLAGNWHHIYDTIPTIWNGTQPIYLPSMWQPFVFAVLFGVDMRWITVAGLLFAFGVFVFVFQPDSKSYRSFFTAALAFLLFWWLFADDTAGVISVSEEGVVIAYYVFLVLALVSGNPWLTGIAASLCMLSRYALVGWIPAYLVYLLLTKKWKKATIFSFMGVVCLLFLFIFPVGWQTFLRLLKLPGDYIHFAGVVWQDSPDVFSTSLGFAGLFGVHHIALLHVLLITLSFAVPMLFMIYCYWRRWKKPESIANIPLATLKLSLVVFYSFIDVPYLYLFYTSSFVSLISIALLLRRRKSPGRSGREEEFAGEKVSFSVGGSLGNRPFATALSPRFRRQSSDLFPLGNIEQSTDLVQVFSVIGETRNLMLTAEFWLPVALSQAGEDALMQFVQDGHAERDILMTFGVVIAIDAS